MRKRKLITAPTMQAILVETNRGVPLARAMRNHKLNMSRPAVAKLLAVYKDLLYARLHERESLIVPVTLSMFPDWLVTDEQEQPDSMYYKGTWPVGEWVWIQ